MKEFRIADGLIMANSYFFTHKYILNNNQVIADNKYDLGGAFFD